MSIVAQYYAEALMKTAALAIYIYGTDKHIVLLFCIHLHFSQYNTFINIFPNLLLRMVSKTLAKYVDALTETSYKIIVKEIEKVARLYQNFWSINTRVWAVFFIKKKTQS